MCETWCKPDNRTVCTLYQIIHCFVKTALDTWVAELQYTFWKLQRLLARGWADLEDEGLETWVKMLLETIIGRLQFFYRPPDSDSSTFASSLEQS